MWMNCALSLSFHLSQQGKEIPCVSCVLRPQENKMLIFGILNANTCEELTLQDLAMP